LGFMGTDHVVANIAHQMTDRMEVISKAK
jgi:hypothetical protein